MVLGPEGTSIGLKKSEKSGSREGMDHFGFTTNSLADLESLDKLLETEKIPFEKKEHRDGIKSRFITDPNGYQIQIVYMPGSVSNIQ